MFADDTCLFITVDNRDAAGELVNEDLQRISSWAGTWLVDFSARKTKDMIVSNKENLDQHPPIVFNDHVIDQVETHKHLGLTLSGDLKWTSHITNVVNSSSRKLDLMRGLKYKLDRRSLETIYKSFVRPSLEYGDCLWAGTYDTDLIKLDAIQNEALRIVTGATARSNIDSLYDELDWQTLDVRRTNHCLTMMYKIVNGLVPSYLSALLPPRIGHNVQHNLRNRHDIRAPFCRLESYRRSFLPKTIGEWNALNETIKSKETVESFKASFVEQKDPMKELLYYGYRLPSVHHSRLRIGCSNLNAHLCFNLHVVPSPQCPCGYEVEDTAHYFFHCPQFTDQRHAMMQSLRRIDNIDININTLLWGDSELTKKSNEEVFDSVQTFIVATSRFE
jgi:hypothetical protein